MPTTPSIPLTGSSSSAPPDAVWMAQYKVVFDFESANKHPNIPVKTNPSFASWMKRQREYFKKGTLHQDKIRLLQGLGIDLSLFKREVSKIQKWIESYDKLKIYHGKNGHSTPPRKTEDTLAQWCVKQRRRNNSIGEKLANWQKALLVAIDFDWDPDLYNPAAVKPHASHTMP